MDCRKSCEGKECCNADVRGREGTFTRATKERPLRQRSEE
jgi:hypothetical protein